MPDTSSLIRRPGWRGSRPFAGLPSSPLAYALFALAITLAVWNFAASEAARREQSRQRELISRSDRLLSTMKDLETATLRQAALARLGDRLRDLSDTAAIIAVATTILGESLELTQAGYGAIDLSSETIEIAPGWRATDVPAIAGLHRFRDYGSFVDQLKRGETVLISDVTHDPRTADQAAAFVTLGTRALANHPIMEHGRFVATFFALKAQPHDWADDEVAFIRDVADRTRAAIARIEAEDRQQTLKLELSHRMKSMLAMVRSIATQTMRGAGDLDVARDVLANRSTLR